MLKAERMSKITVIGPKTVIKRCIEKLHELNVCHIVEHKKTEELDIGMPLESAEDLSETLVKLRVLISQLEIKKRKINHIRQLNGKDYSEIKKKVNVLHSEISKDIESKKELSDKISALKEKVRLINTVNKIRGFDIAIRDSEYLACLVGFVNKNNKIKEEIFNITDRFKIESVEYNTKELIALLIEKDKKSQAQEVLNQAFFEEIDLSSLEGIKNSQLNIASMQKELKELIAERQTIDKKIANIAENESLFLFKNERILSEEAKKAEAPLKFGATEKSFVITGYVPKKRFQSVKNELDSVTNERIFVREESITHEDNVPIKLKNPRIAKPFEFLLGLYGLPRYTEIDPTFLMSITFPIFFGIMLGDVGYGIVTLALFIALKRKLPSLKPLLNIMIFASIMTIVFGFAFGEFFGFEAISEKNGEWLCSNTGICFEKVAEEAAVEGGEVLAGEAQVEYLYEFPRLINRMNGEMNVFGYTIPAVLVIGAIIGILHINLSILLGFYNELVAHGIKAAFFEKISWLIMETGIILIVLSKTGANLNVWIGGVVFLISLLLIYLGEGAKGIIELPSIASNVLSYMRLGAVGLASVGLAVVINEKLSMPFIEKGGFFILIGIIILVIGHLINIALGLIGPFLHSTRLHYVEFFLRFYKGGGTLYKPFGVEKEY